MQKLKVGFIGLGLMGKPMALNILKKGYPLAVYNRTKQKTADLAAGGARVFPSPKELAQNVDVVITMVTNGRDVKKVLFGAKGVVSGVSNKDFIVIDMSTIGPKAAVEIADRLQVKGIGFIDAPVTGSTPKAKSGELTIFAGGDKNIFAKIKPLLKTMGANIHHLGPVGSGQAIKLINNHLIAASVLALGEGMILADSMHLSRQKAAEVLETVPALSDFMRLKLPNFVSNEYPLLFSVANMAKDVSLARQEMRKARFKLPVLTTVEKVYKKALLKMPNEDMSKAVKIFEKRQK